MSYIPYVNYYHRETIRPQWTDELKPWDGLDGVGIQDKPSKSKDVRIHVWRAFIWLAERADVAPNKLIKNINVVKDSQLYYWCKGTDRGQAITIPSMKTIDKVKKETGVCLAELTKDLINHQHDREQFNSLLDSALALLGFQPKRTRCLN